MKPQLLGRREALRLVTALAVTPPVALSRICDEQPAGPNAPLRQEVTTPFGKLGLRPVPNAFGQVAVAPHPTEFEFDSPKARFELTSWNCVEAEWALYSRESDGKRQRRDRFANSRLIDAFWKYDKVFRRVGTKEPETSVLVRPPTGGVGELRAMQTPRLDELARASIRNHQKDIRGAALHCDCLLDWEQWPSSVALAVRLSASDRNGRVLAEDYLIAASGPGIDVTQFSLRFANGAQVEEYLSDAGSQLQLQGLPSLAWRDVWKDEYWAGSMALERRW